MTKRTLASLLTSLVVASFAGAAGCDSATTTVTELELDQSIEINFESMKSGLAEDVGATLGDMRGESRYVDLLSELQCAGVSLSGSNFFVRELAADVDAVPLQVELFVAPSTEPECDPKFTGTRNFATLPAFSRLATLNASVRRGDTVPYTESTVKVFEAGRERASKIALSDRPNVCIGVVGSATREVQSLKLDLNVQLDFSSHPAGCP